MGLFRKFCSGESKTFRYVSDSSYWLYLVHLPLVIFGQGLLLRTDWPALVEFGVLLVATSAVLLVSYRYLVRYTPIGTLLNGRRGRERAVRSVPATVPTA